jgi:hypothetical protein
MNRDGTPVTERLKPAVRTGGREDGRPAVRLVALIAGAAVILAFAAARTGGPNSTSVAGAESAQALAAAVADVEGRPWLSLRGDDRWVWGKTGERERHELPSGELGLAVGDAWVVSALPTAGKSRLIVRDMAGATILESDLPFWVAAAAVTGDTLLLSGYADNSAASDAGVVAVSLPDGVIHELTAGGPFAAALGDTPSKGDFRLSGSGATAAINTCGSLACDTVVIDVPALTATTPMKAGKGYLRAVTDEVFLVTDGDGDTAQIRGLDNATGRRAFAVTGLSLMQPVAMADGQIIANIGDPAKGWYVAALDKGGRLTPLTTPAVEHWPWVWSEVSSPTIAVLGDQTFEEALSLGQDVSAELVRGSDLGTAGSAVVLLGE